MPLRSPRRIHRATHRAIVTMVATSLLLMAVTYRGGAEAAHAHTIFQLWADVRSGSFTHHGRDEEPGARGEGSGPAGTSADEGDGHAEMGHGTEDEPGPDADDLSSDHGAEPVVVDAATWELVTGSPTGLTMAVDGDAPVASSAFTPSVRGMAFVLPTAAMAPIAESFSPAMREPPRLDGVVTTPTAPPPRQAA